MTDEWGKAFYGDLARVGDIYLRGSSLVVTHRGSWHEVGDSALVVIEGMVLDWRNEADDFRRCYYQFEKYGTAWVLGFDVAEMPRPRPAGQPKATTLKVRLDQTAPHKMTFSVIYHPKVVDFGRVDLEGLLESSLYRLPYIAEDLSHFADWIRLMNENYIVIYHDRELTTRIDVVMGHSRLPYRFIIAYHIDKPHISADLHIVTSFRNRFDTIAESVLDEHWKEILGGGA